MIHCPDIIQKLVVHTYQQTFLRLGLEGVTTQPELHQVVLDQHEVRLGSSDSLNDVVGKRLLLSRINEIKNERLHCGLKVFFGQGEIRRRP